MFITERIISLIAPHNCVICGAEGSVLCSWCKPEFLDRLPSRCYICHKLTLDFAVCKSCVKKTPLRHVWVASRYTDATKRLIELLKFKRGQAASVEVAAVLDEIVPVLSSDTVVAHVPTATSRRRQRGYDQSELVAKQFAKLRLLKSATVLARTGQTRQVGSTKKQRQQQMERAFRPVDVQRIKGSTILLIDDLTTTGATIESAARVLKKAGAKKVFAATLAQRV